MATGSAVGSLLVRIGADTGGLRRGGRQAETAIQRIGRRASAVATRLAQFATAAAAAGAALTAHLVRTGMQAVSEQAKLARRLNSTIDSVRGLQLVAQDAGVELGTMNQAMERLQQSVGEARRGVGTAAEVFDTLGISVERFASLNVDQRFALLAARMNDANFSADQVADALRQLGIRQADVVNLMQEGEAAFRDARAEIDELGLSLDAIDAQKVENAEDAMSRIGTIMEGVSQRLAVEFAPLIESVAEAFMDWRKEAFDTEQAVRGFVNNAINGFAALADAIALSRRGLALVGLAGEQARVAVQRGALMMAEAIMGAPVRAVNVLIGRYNTFLSMIGREPIGDVGQPEFLESLSAALEESTELLEENRRRADQIMGAPYPSDAIWRWVEESREAANLRAVEIEESRQRDEEGQEESNQRVLDREREHTEALREILGDRFGLEEGIAQRGNQRLLDIQEQFDAAMLESTRRRARLQREVMDDTLNRMSTMMSSHSRTMFEVGKTAAIAESIVSTYRGMSKALELGWPLGPIAAGAIGAAGFANVQNIRSQSFSRGGGGSAQASQGGPVGALPGTGGGQQPAGGGGPNTIIQLHGGDMFGPDQIRQLAEHLNEHNRDGGRVIVA